jgi:hypothetical protein
MGIADWAYDMYEEAPVIDTSMTFMLTSIRIGTVMLTTVSSYEACVATVDSFYWDNDNQVAYMHLQLHPHSLSSIDSSPVFGVTYGRPVEFNGIVYNNTLLSKPSIERNTEPVVYQKMATQSLSIELINDELWGVDPRTHKPYKYYRFDNTSDLNGQSTYLRYGEDGETDYSKLRLLHKGIISKITKSGTRLNIVCDDVRTRQDATWPTYTYEDAGYTVDDIDEDLLTSVIPDGFGYNEKMPMVCVNKSYAVIQKDDDDEIVLPSNELTWDINSWTKSGIITTRIDDKIGGFDSFRIAKSTSSNGYVNRSFTATDIKHKISGYIRCDVANTPTGNTVVSIAGKAVINFQLIDHTFTSSAGSNVRVKYTVDDSGKVTAFFSMEAQELTIGSSYTLYIYADDSSSSSSAIVVSAIRVSEVEYPQFRIANRIDDTKTLHFDADAESEDYIELDNMLTSGNDFSIGLYVKTTSATATQCLASTRTEVGGGVSIFILDGKIRFDTDEESHWAPNYIVPVGQWIHLVCTKDSTGKKLYVNGTLVDSTNEVGTMSTLYSIYTIGASNASGININNFLVGTLKDYFVYNRALSDTEVSSIFSNNKYPDNGILGRWLLNEGTGAVANDLIGSNDGTIYGATWEYPLDVYYEEDGEFIKVNNVISTEPSSAIVTIHDIDAHEDGVITNGLKKFFCSS